MEGMYLRTKDNGICQIIRFGSSLGEGYVENEKGFKITKDGIIKSCYNIMELLEVGDIIRYRIDNVSLETKGCLEGVLEIEDKKELNNIKQNKDFHILSIVTKEQFVTIQYKVV